ncbi:MAG: 4'-phosphopantetheinyl transferase superfamily protein [Acidobacteriota bacterium]
MIAEIPLSGTMADPFAAPTPKVERGEVLCVEVDLGQDEERWWELAAPRITAGEAARTRRFYRRRDAIRHAVGRALIRTMLARQLGRPAVDNELATNAFGKPALPASDLEFSISHSGDQIWVALSCAGAVGIDVERINDAADHCGLADVFHPEECLEIRASTPRDARDAFYRGWTRNEAVVKALGLGLSLPLSDFRVLTGTAVSGWLVEPPSTAPDGWSCFDLPHTAGYHASVAVTSPDVAITAHRLALRGTRTVFGWNQQHGTWHSNK